MTTSARRVLTPAAEDPAAPIVPVPIGPVGRPSRVRWSEFPPRDRPVTFLVWMLLAVGAGGLGVWGSGEPLGAVLTVLVLLAVRDLFLPVQYELDGDSVQRTCLGVHRRIPWRAVDRWSVSDERLVLQLSPSAAPWTHETVVLPFGRKRRSRSDKPLPEQVRNWVEHQSRKLG